MKLEIHARNTEGVLRRLPSPIEMIYDAGRETPCDALELTVPLCFEGEDFCQLTLTAEGSIQFDGIVDRQIREKSGRGNRLRLECRSRTALLLDNELKPCFYFQLTSAQLFEQYLAPYGVKKAHFPYPAKRNFIQIKKGTCVWVLTEQFCDLVYDAAPFLTPGGELTLQPLGQKSYTLSNRAAGALPYLSLKFHQRNDKLISRVHMKTATETYGNYYGFTFDNPEAVMRRVQRERYHHPVHVVTEHAKLETRRILQQSNQDSFLCEAELPGIHLLELGGRVRLPDEEKAEALIIQEIRCEVSESGAVTTLRMIRETSLSPVYSRHT